MIASVLRVVGVLLGSTLALGVMVALALVWLVLLALQGGVDEPRHWWE